MFERLMVLGLLALGSCWVGSGCTSTTTEKSTGTNWLDCDTDSDCAFVEGARCGPDSVCVDRDGNKIVSGSQARDSGVTSTNVADAAAAQAHDSGTTSPITTDSGTATTFIVVDCYSPGQNLDLAYDVGSVGCECAAGAQGTCINGVALGCSDGHWRAVIDGACDACWNPTDTDLAKDSPTSGCSCSTGEMDACSYSQFTGYIHASCTGGTWQLGTSTLPCASCTSDSQCSVYERCVSGTCQSAGVPCSVNGVLYRDGTDGIPDPFSCNTCTCSNGGYLGCTTVGCLETEECPPGTTPAAICGACGTAGGCAYVITGCRPTCQTDADCELGMVCQATQWPGSESARACTYAGCF